MKKILRIGEFSKLNNISIQTLRFYDQIGLLKPYQIDEETGYRSYHINQSSIVDSIQYLRQLDFSLEEIKEILSDKEQSHLHQLIEERYQQLQAEKEALEKRLEEIEVFRSGALLYRQKQFNKKLEIMEFPLREVLTFDLDKNIYQMTSEEYELYLRYFKQEILHYNPFFHHFGRVGSLMPQEKFQKQDWVAKQFILFQQERLDLPNMKDLPLAQGLYAVSYCASFEEEIQALPLFFKAIKMANYQIVGDYICEVIHEQPSLTSNQRDMFIRMQVRIEKGSP